MSSTASEHVPEVVPARMVNEFVYCPRLFHIEWVQSRFASNDDVEQGLYVHRVVDVPSGDLPSVDGPDDAVAAGRRSRSVWLTSDRLGLTAKVDMVEVLADGSVAPVDYKKGSPSPSGEAWPADVVQVAVQAMLLRDAGYGVHSAEIWYDEVKRRVVVRIDEALVAQTLETLERLREVASSDAPPAPLVNSPKCPRCSVVGLCLPDEINTLRARGATTRAARRIVPRNPDPRPLYVDEQGAVVGVSGGRVTVTKEGERLASVRLIDVGQVCVRGNVMVTPQAVRTFMAADVPVCWFTYGGWFNGMATGLPGKNVDLRRAQFTTEPGVALSVAKRMVEGKIRNSRTLLRRNGRDVDSEVSTLGRSLEEVTDVAGFPTLLGVEGAAARTYFSAFSRMLKQGTDLRVDLFEENGRGRRPPPDPINALLSYVYALLVKDVTVALWSVGFDPYVGVYHRPRFGRPALALDLAEEFRPLLGDSTVLQVVNNGEVKASHLTSRAGAWQLDKDGRRAVLRAYERRMSHEIKHPTFGYQVSYRRAIDVQARILAAHLLGELPEYTPFTTR